MTEHLTNDKKLIPAGLARRWKEFGEASIACWSRPKVEKALKEKRIGDAFELHSTCMRTEAAGVHLMSVAEAKKYGVKAHPICTLSLQMKEGISKAEAERRCVELGHFHGISLLRGELEMAKEKEEL